MVWRRNRKRIKTRELHPDEILLDARNLPSFDKQQFEGQLERPIAKKPLRVLYAFMTIVGLYFVGVLSNVQIVQHDFYKERSEKNSLDHVPIFADRGVVYDRNGVELVSNIVDDSIKLTHRSYTKDHGFSNLLGYVSYPAKDQKGIFWQDRTLGKDGVEKEFDAILAGENGTQLIETNVQGEVVSGGVVEPPVQGNNLTLAVDARVQKALYEGIRALSEQSGYVGGTGIVMDINTGELYAVTSFPEYNSNIMSKGEDRELINHYLKSESRPLLNRAIDGVYTPGSIVKPFFALGALEEKIITPNKIIFTNGKLEIPNPYNPAMKTVFKDNANHGPVNMTKALSVSSNVYFYEIGGGFGDQKGLGIANLEKYARLFGLGQKTGIDIIGEREGNIPSIEWKAKRFPGDQWRIGDTYNTAIGQYGFQVTPMQMVRAVSALASRGVLQTPTIIKTTTPKNPVKLSFKDSSYTAVHEGMRASVIEGTTRALNTEALHLAAKSGTAQIKNNTRVNSWVIGFFPYENPRFAFTVLMEDGPKISSGAVHAFKPVVDLFVNTPELLSQ